MKPQAVIFDIDGTIADCSHRLHFIQPPAGLIHFKKDETDWKPDWDAFYDACAEDKPIIPVIDLCNIVGCLANRDIIFITGRPERMKNPTLTWIMKRTALKYCSIYMRKDGDHRPDWQVKREIYETQIKDKYDVIGVFEDRDQCVQMWRELGLQCYQVNKGDY